MTAGTESVRDRQSEGCRAGLVGVTGNLSLVGVKLAVGMLSNSIAVMADAFNNAADAFSSLITLIGFRFSGKAGDEKHPYGYGRMEYVSGFVVSLAILLTALSLGKAAVRRLLAPAPVEATPLFGAALLLSVAVKLGLAWYTFRMDKRLNSSALRAAAVDNMADAAVTGVTLAGMALSPCTAFPVDACAGLLVVGALMYSGLRALRENLDFLLGLGPDQRLTARVRSVVLAHDAFTDVVSFELHDYGPAARMAAVRVAVRETATSEETERALREAAESLRREYGMEARIYVDAASKGRKASPCPVVRKEEVSVGGVDGLADIPPAGRIFRGYARPRGYRRALAAVWTPHFWHRGARPDRERAWADAVWLSREWKEHSARG